MEHGSRQSLVRRRVHLSFVDREAGPHRGKSQVDPTFGSKAEIELVQASRRNAVMLLQRFPVPYDVTGNIPTLEGSELFLRSLVDAGRCEPEKMERAIAWQSPARRY